MWCPPDCHNLRELLDLSDSAAWQIVPFIRGSETVYTDESKSEIDYERSNSARRLAAQGKLIDLFMGENRGLALACSPTGQVFRVSGEVVRPPIYYNFFRYNKIFCRHPELLYVDIDTGVIHLEGVASRMESWTDFQDGHLWQERGFRDFGHLNGWSICFRRNEVALTLVDLHRLWERKANTVRPPGRPRDREYVAAAYMRRFPEGHGGLSWKEVLAILRTDEAVDTSRDTLLRALGLRT